MSIWLVFRVLYLYVNERFPFVSAAVFSVATVQFITLSLNAIAVNNISSPSVLIPVITLILFLFRLRLLDDIKDYSHDFAHYIERLHVREQLSKQSLFYAFFLVILVEVLMQVIFLPNALWIYGLFLLYTILMGFEFFIKTFLQTYRSIQLFMHEFVFVIFTLYCFSALTNTIRLSIEFISVCLVAAIAPTIFELGRKIKHRKSVTGSNTQDTYAHWWGPGRTLYIIFVLLGIMFSCMFFLSNSLALGLLLSIIFILFGTFLFFGRPTLLKTAELWSKVLPISCLYVYIIFTYVSI